MTHSLRWHRRLLLLALPLGWLLLATGCSDDDSGDPCKDVPDSCDIPDGKSCDSDTILTCVDNGGGCLVWVPTDTCPAGLACFGGSCVCDDECVPGTNQCDGNTIQRCAETIEGCLYWEDDQDCSTTELSCDDTEDATCVEGAGCGNDMLEPPEVCDGPDLGGEDCLTQGFGEGQLACNNSCNGYDTSACLPSPSCGNETIETPEVCDGSELGGADCVSQGFHGGDLACRVNCGAYDTSGCDGFCGDGGVNGPEQCDMNDLGGLTCDQLGFYEGTLTCDASCMVNTSGCSGFCGDGVVDTDEICDGTDVGLLTCLDFGYPGGGTLSCPSTCDYIDVSQCVSPWTVTTCWIHSPAPSATAVEYSAVTVTGQVWIAGLTDLQSGPDPDLLVWADVGVGPDGSDPSQSPTGWSWYPALPVPGFSHPTDDQYKGDLIAPAAAGSPYDYAVRISVDAGQTWTHCDLTDHVYTPGDTGHLVATP